MSIKGNFCLLSIILFCVVFFLPSCNNDEDKEDIVEQVTLYVSAETGMFYNVPNIDPEEGMQIKEIGAESWTCVSFSEISGFTYELGYEYELLVKKITLAYPPLDARKIRYELINIVSKTKVDP